MEELKEFTNRIKKVSEPRSHGITNSWGMKDAFNYYRKIRPKDKKYVLTDCEYYAIIKAVNNAIIEQFMDKGYFNFPMGVGSLFLSGFDNKPTFKDGKLKYIAPVDWTKTYALWHEDKEAFNARTVIKIEPGTVYKISFQKGKVLYKNKSYYKMKIGRTLKQALKDRVVKNKDFTAFHNCFKVLK